ncbi:hypothetical protein [Nocardia brevicatena]|uniref:hypothetical protein n=1 Tax=Nocardia brevicatena TaxID=37327 RepID=UPI001C3F3BFD|nr:hypothetical protein [Nocardia brevicatena]
MPAVRLMTDHPGWVRDGAEVRRAVTDGRSVSVLTAGGHGDVLDLRVDSVQGRGAATVVEEFDPAALSGPDSLVSPLKHAGVVVRVANPSLWDAIATAIVRQVIRAATARALYRSFGRATGAVVDDGGAALMWAPAPEVVLRMSDSEFADLRMTFQRKKLVAAAAAFLEHGERWSMLRRTAEQRAELVEALVSVPGIGAWTAGAAVADYTNDFGLYPFSDLAVRTWAARMAPELGWPDTEPEFAAVWREIAGEQLSQWTLLTLAWGGTYVEQRL